MVKIKIEREKIDRLLDHPLVMKLLDWAYNKALSGMGGVDSAIELGDSYLKQKGSLTKQVDSLIKWQVAKAGTSGFITGFGGLATMPFTLPANIVSVIYLQIRMIAAIAYMGGYDLKSDRVKSFIYICMVGNGAKELLKDIGIKAGEKIVTNIIKDISAKTIIYVNQKVGYKVLSKLGGKGLSNFGKAVPVAGGLIGAGFDAVSTKLVGNVAKRMFITGK